jgi:hypothetical protein
VASVPTPKGTQHEFVAPDGPDVTERGFPPNEELAAVSAVVNSASFHPGLCPFERMCGNDGILGPRKMLRSLVNHYRDIEADIWAPNNSKASEE